MAPPTSPRPWPDGRGPPSARERGERRAARRAHGRRHPARRRRARPSAWPTPGPTVVHVPLIEIGRAGRRRRRRCARALGPARRVRLARRHVGERRRGGRRRPRPASRRPPGRGRAGDGGGAREARPAGPSTSSRRWPTAEGLLAEFPPTPARVLLAQADRAGARLADGLRAAGHDVEAVEAYATRPLAARRRAARPARRRRRRGAGQRLGGRGVVARAASPHRRRLRPP